MKQYILNYCPEFKCVADKCKHTCCAGWEMCIDACSLNDYKANDTAFSKFLNKGINYKKSKFKADKKGRCAFLNEKGLCEIIINLGEQSLCQVCRDHPRFRAFFNDRVETGLGFSCEEATRIILSFKDKIKPTLLSDDGKTNSLDFNQNNILGFRDSALKIVQNRSANIDDRISDLLALCRVQVSTKDLDKTIKTFLSLERLDKKWTKSLKGLKDKNLNLKTGEDFAHYAEQFIANGIFRHLYDAEDTISVRTRTTAIVLCWWVVKNLIERECEKVGQIDFGVVVEMVRAFSAEVEYSQNNLKKLFKFTSKFIKI